MPCRKRKTVAERMKSIEGELSELRGLANSQYCDLAKYMLKALAPSSPLG